MRARERERFLRMNFTEKELEIRDRIYKVKRELARFKMVITAEHYNKRKHLKEVDPDGTLGYANGYLAYFCEYPEDGTYLDTVYFNDPDEYRDILTLYEGMFYQLFDMKTGDRIGYGSFDPDSPIEEIRERIGEDCCETVCKFCFWRGLLYQEAENVTKNGMNFYTCYNKKEMPVWEKELLKDWR